MTAKRMQRVTVVISGFMIPEQALSIPIYRMFANLILPNTYFARIIPGVTAPVAVFLLAQSSGLTGGVAAAWLAGLPLITLFPVFQKYIFNGFRAYSDLH